MPWTARPTPAPVVHDHAPRPPRPRPRRSRRHPLPGACGDSRRRRRRPRGRRTEACGRCTSPTTRRARPVTSPRIWPSWVIRPGPTTSPPARRPPRRCSPSSCPTGPRCSWSAPRRSAAEITAVGLTPVDSADGATAVVQGLDPQLRYATLAEACIALRAGAVWVACNVDPTLPSERGPLPGNGSLVAVLRTATRLEPQVAGKPAPALMQTAARRVGGVGAARGRRPPRHGHPGRSRGRDGDAAGAHRCLGRHRTAGRAGARPGRTTSAPTSEPSTSTRTTLAVGPRPGWTVDGGPDGLVLSGVRGPAGRAAHAVRPTLGHRWWPAPGSRRGRRRGRRAARAGSHPRTRRDRLGYRGRSRDRSVLLVTRTQRGDLPR